MRTLSGETDTTFPHMIEASKSAYISAFPEVKEKPKAADQVRPNLSGLMSPAWY